MNDMYCMVCNADIYGTDKSSVSIVEWVPEQNRNILRASLCTNPTCLRNYGDPSHYQWRPKGKHPEQKPKDKK